MIVDIDVNLPRILAARGMSRRQIGATLRALEDQEAGHLPLGDAYYEMALALGGTALNTDDGHLSYNAAIAKGVRMREMPATSKGNGHTSTTVVVRGEIPTTAITAMIGAPLSRLVEHPLLPEGAQIVGMHTADGETHAYVETRRRSIAVEAPATLNDIAVVRCRMWWRHRRNALDAGAVEGMSPRTIAYLLCILATGALVAWMIGHVAETATWTALIALAFGVYRYGRDDEGLDDRLWDMRRKRLADRRTAILEGTKT